VEVVRGISINEIFQTNGNWLEFQKKFGSRIRPSVFVNVAKVFLCKTGFGYQEFTCPKSCGHSQRIPFTCKSRFCSPCGKVQTDNWCKKYEATFLDVPYQHIVFTIPSLLWPIIQCNRQVGLNLLVKAAMQTVLDYTKNTHGYTPAVMAVIHTFGRDLKFNTHVHLLVSCGGLSKNKQKWIPNSYLHHKALKTIWRTKIMAAFREQIPNISSKLLNQAYSSAQDWYVHVGKKLGSAKKVVKYIGRYTKRPAIAQTRISSFENNQVTFWYEDHKEKQKINVTLSAQDFIKKLLPHIHDQNFKQIRYSGLLAPSIRTKALSTARFLLGKGKAQLWFIDSWRQRIKDLTDADPLICPNCQVELQKTATKFVSWRSIYGFT